MFYVVAHDHYYPCGGFSDVKFKGYYSDCEKVAEKLRLQYDYVQIVDPDIETDIDTFL